MRRAAKVDANQPDIVRALRAVGATVQPLHSVGSGCPDLLVGYRRANHLLEIKDGSLAPSRRTLTPDQVEWHRDWRGAVIVVQGVSDALRAIGIGRPDEQPLQAPRDTDPEQAA